MLASRSPRRRELLREYGFEHQAVAPGVDDGLLLFPRAGVSPAGWTAALAWLKARAGVANATAEGIEPPMLVLAADTVVVHSGEVIGQPRDANDAARIIHRLAEDEHTVLTGVALLTVDELPPARTDRRDGPPWPARLLIDRATVRVGSIPTPSIDAYVASGAWQGKAGAYNLRERLEAGWPIDFDGDPTSIMGLPMARLAPALRTALDALAGHASSGIVLCSTDWLAPDDDPLHDSAGGIYA